MEFDWSALKCVEMGSWLLAPNRVFPYSILIHGGAERPNPAAKNLAERIMAHYEMFATSAKLHVRALVNPRIVEDGVEVDAFHFDDRGNSFEVHLVLRGDRLAHWRTRFARSGGDHINDFSPCELTRIEQ